MEFLTYKRFQEQNEANWLLQILKDNHIEFSVTEDRESLDSLYGDKSLNRLFDVKIMKKDFSKVDSILLSLSEKEVETVDADHYLYSFTDDELFDILSKPDEWSEFDYSLAKKILKSRGKEINNEIIELLKNQRIQVLSKPEEGSRVWIFAGYLFSLIGGLIGIFIGLSLITTKKTLPNGQKIHVYSVKDRNHGTRIFLLGIVMFIISVIIRIVYLEA
jgi:hypothetical protein